MFQSTSERAMEGCSFLMIIVLASIIGIVVDAESKHLALQGFLPMSGTSWTGGGACLPAVRMALRHVRERRGLLDGYNLTYSWVNTQCNPGVAIYQLFKVLNQQPTKIMMLGCGCSITSEATAQVTHLFNLTQIAYGSSSPILSDRKRFPNFYRLIGPDQKLNPAKIALMREFDWRKVATINQALEFFSMVIDDFVQSVKDTDISIISQEIFQHNPQSRVENLKARDARIIITACYEDKARLLLCSAYKVGLYGPKVVLMFHAWYSAEFWRHNLDDVPCTLEEMDLAAEGAFVIGFFFRNPTIERGVAGITVPEFEELYKKEETYDIAHRPFEFVAAMCYDHVWVAALALNCTDTYLKANGHPKSLDKFTYEDSDINNIILSCMSNISITGIVGGVSFGKGADPIKNIKIERIQGGNRVMVGTFVMEEEPRYLEWSGDGIMWEDGNIPRDSTYVLYEEESIPTWLFATMSSCAALGIAMAIGFFLFNVKHRNNRIVKLSSPNINNVLLLGCVLSYSTVFMKTAECDVPTLCKTRTFCFSLGFTIAFGALFSKTWRVYKIFTNKKLLKLTIKDYQLIGLVCILSGIILVILILWELVAPQILITQKMDTYVHVIGNDAEIRHFIRVCYSENGVYFSWTIYAIEGILLAFGAFLAWETRHNEVYFSWTIYAIEVILLAFWAFLAWETRRVQIEALNDSHQIGMCLYNAVVLSAVGLTLTLLLGEQVVVLYGITSGCVIIGTTVTQAIVFVPKVMDVYGRSPTSVNPLNSMGSTNVASRVSGKVTSVAVVPSTTGSIA